MTIISIVVIICHISFLIGSLNKQVAHEREILMLFDSMGNATQNKRN